MRLCICVLIVLSLVLSVACAAAPATTAPAAVKPPTTPAKPRAPRAPKAPIVVKYHLSKTIQVGGDGGWDLLTFDSTSNRLYIARSTRVQVVDVDKGTVVGEVPNTQGVHGVALVASLKRGYASNGTDNSVTIFDLTTLKEVERIKVGTRPDTIIYDPGSKRVFTFNGASHDATAIDVATNKVAGTVQLGGKPEFADADGKGVIFVNIEDKNEIVSFDAKTLAVKNHWPLKPGTGPSGLAIDRKNRRLFSVCDNEMMVITDADTGKVVATPKIGKGPDAARFDRVTKLALSSNGQDGTLTVIREDTKDKFTVLANVPTQASARTMTLNRKNHNVYLAAAKAIPPPAGSTPTGRPKMEPNSFVILVFAP